MNITISKSYNEVYNQLSIFNVLVNFDYFEIQMKEQWSVHMNEALEDYAVTFKEDEKFFDSYHYLGMDMKTRDLFLNGSFLYSSSDIKEYHNKLKEISHKEYQVKILKALDIKDETSLLNALDKLEVKADIKWFYLSFYNNPLEYIDKFISMVEQYLPLYKIIKKDYDNDYKDFRVWIEDKVSEESIDYLIERLKFLNLSEFKNVDINFSLLDLSSTYEFGDTVKLSIGTVFKNYVEGQENTQDAEVHLNTYKVLSDPTRFEILRILSEKESYGQEIAEQLNISTATVSYHIEFLLGASLITMNRKSRRIYYVVNKDQLVTSINYINNVFDLDI